MLAQVGELLGGVVGWPVSREYVAASGLPYWLELEDFADLCWRYGRFRYIQLTRLGRSYDFSGVEVEVSSTRGCVQQQLLATSNLCAVKANIGTLNKSCIKTIKSIGNRS